MKMGGANPGPPADSSDDYPDMSRYATEFVTDPLPSPVRNPLLGGFNASSSSSSRGGGAVQEEPYPDMSRYNTSALVPPTPAPSSLPSRPRRNTQFLGNSGGAGSLVPPSGDAGGSSGGSGDGPKRPRRKSVFPSGMGAKKLSMTGTELLQQAYGSDQNSSARPPARSASPPSTPFKLPDSHVDKTNIDEVERVIELIDQFKTELDRSCARFADAWSASQSLFELTKERNGTKTCSTRDTARVAFLKQHLVDGVPDIASFWAKALNPDDLNSSDVKGIVAASGDRSKRARDRLKQFRADESNHAQWLESERARLQREMDQQRENERQQQRLIQERRELERVQAEAERERLRRVEEENRRQQEKERREREEREKEEREKKLAAAREMEEQRMELERIRAETERIRREAEAENQRAREIEEARQHEAELMEQRRRDAEAERLRLEAEAERAKLAAELEQARLAQEEERLEREREREDHERELSEIRERARREQEALELEQERQREAIRTARMMASEGVVPGAHGHRGSGDFTSGSSRSRRVQKKKFVPETPAGEPSPTPKAQPMMRHPTPTNPGQKPVILDRGASGMPGTRKRPVPPRRRGGKKALPVAAAPSPAPPRRGASRDKPSYIAETPDRNGHKPPPRRARGASSTAELLKKHRETPRVAESRRAGKPTKKPPKLSISSPAASATPDAQPSNSPGQEKPRSRPRGQSSRRSKQAVALYDFVPENEDELEFKEGDKLLILKELQAGWSEGLVLSTGQRGICPTAYVKCL